MRKGQLTIFIILGLILLITIGIVLYFVITAAEKPWREASKVPEDIRPVYDMVNDCTKIALKQGLIIQGLQAGYIDVPAFVISNPDSYLAADPLGVIKIPYWYHDGENRIPSTPLMQLQLARYVKEQVKECVNLKAFEPQLSVQELGEPNVLITFAEEETVAEVKWPLKITTPQRTIVQTDYFATQEVRYKEIYELAAKVLDEENKQEWLEKLTIDLMSADEKIPMGGMEAGCKQKRWNIETIQDRLKDILFYIMPMIRIQNTPQLNPIAKMSVYEDLKDWAEEEKEKLIEGETTTITQPEYIPADTYEVNKMTFDVKIPKTNLKATFVYDKSKLLLNVLPHDGRWLKSKVVRGSKQLIPFFCMNQWHFSYDIIYPVKVVLKDEEAFNNEGYVFQFAFPVVISDNSPERVDFGIRQFEPMYIGTEFCEQPGEREIEVKVLGFEPGLPMAVELEDADITIECMSIDCDLGKTQIQSDGEIKLRANLPQGCGNPRVTAKKEGYLDTSSWLTGDKTELVMKGLQKLRPEFVIHPYHKDLNEWQTDQNRFTLADNEKIMLSLKTKKDNFEQYKMFPSNETIELVLDDADYELEIYLLKNDMIIGGYKDLNLTYSYNDILSKDRIQFNVIEYRPNPTNEEELVEMLDWLDKGKYVEEKYQKVLRPILT